MTTNGIPKVQNIPPNVRLNSIISDQTPNADPHVIDQVRKLCREEFEKTSEEFDMNDVGRLMSYDWEVTRFLLGQNGEPQGAAKMILTYYRWKQSTGISRWPVSRFPVEFYELGVCFPYECDKMGNTVVYIRSKFFDRRVPCLRELLREFVLYIIDQVDQKHGGRNWAVVYDCEGSGVSNFDWSFSNYMISEILPFLPTGVAYVIIAQLPWMLAKLANGVLPCLPARIKKVLRVLNNDEIQDIISKKSLPDFLGGSCNVDYGQSPKGCTKFEEVTKEQAWGRKDLATINKYYGPYFEDRNRKRSVHSQISEGYKTQSDSEDSLGL